MRDIHRGKTQYVYAINAEENTAIAMWWSEGAYLYLYQTIDRIGSTAIDVQNRIHSVVNVDPMYGEDLSVVAQESWLGYEIMEYNPDYKG
jgi:hypothetical protein